MRSHETEMNFIAQTSVSIPQKLSPAPHIPGDILHLALSLPYFYLQVRIYLGA
jgi:hypothetical protein